jgi:ABC-type Fe3+/spermidine/putrescine transport system ATPase subunit
VGLAEDTLLVRGVTTRAGSFALGPINLDVERGRVLSILGPSGAGKTMLLETIAGFRAAVAGSIRLFGRELGQLPPEGRAIGFVFQDAALFPHLSVRKNVGFALRARGERSYERVDELLDRFAITHLAERLPRSLSGGERQRVALARALAAEPELLLLDEPLSALDRPTRDDLRGVLQELLSGLGIPAIHVTHDRDEALDIGDQVAVVVAGQVRQLASSDEIVAQPADDTCARLLGWSELGVGSLDQGILALGDLVVPTADSLDRWNGLVSVFYRPEAVLLAGDAAGNPGPTRFRATVDRVLATTPLARVTLGGRPTLTVLLLPRDLGRLDIRAGTTVDVELPPDSLRVFRPTGA